MASFEKRGKSIRATVSFPDGKRQETFNTWAEARAWAAETERGKLIGTSSYAKQRIVEDLLLDFLPISERDDSGVWNTRRILKFCNDPVAKVSLDTVSAQDMNKWILRRLETVVPSTVQRELNLFQAAFTHGIVVNKWLKVNPCKKTMDLPKSPPRNRQLLTSSELEELSIASGYASDLTLTTKIARVGACFFLSLETGIRSGELLRIRPKDFQPDKRIVYIHALERGGRKGARSGQRQADRNVPLTDRAIELFDQLLTTMPEDQVPAESFSMPPYIVGLNDSQRDSLWRKARDRTTVKNLTFHDTKHEAATRMAPLMDVIALSHAIGTKNLKYLRDTYYNNDAERIAKTLPESLNPYGTLIRNHPSPCHSKPISPLPCCSRTGGQDAIGLVAQPTRNC